MRSSFCAALPTMIGVVLLSCTGGDSTRSSSGYAPTAHTTNPPSPTGRLSWPKRPGRSSPFPRQPPDSGQGGAGGSAFDSGPAQPVPGDLRPPRHGLEPRKRAHPPPALDIPKPVSCGNHTCSPVPIPSLGFVLRSCCVDPATGTCGIASGAGSNQSCLADNQTAVPDPKCPDASLPQLPGLVLKGCCSKSKCGFILAIPAGPSLGCVEGSTIGLPQTQISCQ